MLIGSFAVGAPAAAVGDAPDLLHINVDHVSGIPGDDLPSWFPVGGPGGVEVAQAADAQAHQPPPDGALADLLSLAVQFGGDGPGGELVLAP